MFVTIITITSTKEYYVPTLHLYVHSTPALYNCTALLKYNTRSKYVTDRNNDNIDANGTCHKRFVIILYACNTTLYRHL